MKKSADKKIKSTREALVSVAGFISGRVLDAGGGFKAKYKSIITSRSKEYVCLDMKPGGDVDVVGNILDMPFENASFDTVVCNQVLEHVPEPEKLVSESYRVLKPGGYFICAAPFLAPIHDDPGDFYRYTAEGLGFMFKKYGFEIVETNIYGGFFAVLYSFIKFSYFNPYKQLSANRRRVARYAEKFFWWLDSFVKPRTVYSNSLVVAKKK